MSQHTTSQAHKQQDGIDYGSMCDKRNTTWNSNFWQPFLPLPETGFCDYLDEIKELAKSAPEIIASIEKDLDIHARKEKKIRLEDKKYFASRTADLPKMDIKERNIFVACHIVPWYACQMTAKIGRFFYSHSSRDPIFCS